MLELGLDVYQTLVDDKGIDCIVRKDANTYYEVQIKARSRQARNPGYFVLSQLLQPRPNYFFILYAEKVDKFWVIPSEHITGSGGNPRLGFQLKGGKNKGQWRVIVPTSAKRRMPNKYDKYENAWHLLGVERELRKETQNA